MANPWPRETFVIPGDAGQVGRTINMIKVDDAFRTQLLTNATARFDRYQYSVLVAYTSVLVAYTAY